MSLITLRNLGLTIGTPLFSNLTFSIEKGDRIGLVASNGRGKSSLLSLIAGAQEPTTGEITTARGLRMALVAQNPPDALHPLSLYDTVLSALDPETAEMESWRVDIVLDDLSVPPELWHTPLAQLSGGWQRVALLARAWVSEPDVLLLDEPTNHLDLSRIGFLQNWIATIARGVPMLIVSHDRAFLDEVTTRTLFLRSEASEEFPLPYTEARAALDEKDHAAARRFENEVAKANQLRRQAAKLKNIGINSGSDLLLKKNKQLKERADSIVQAARPAHQEAGSGQIRLANSGAHAKALISFEPTEICIPDGPMLYTLPQSWISPGDRVVILGANGTGKTQLLTQVIAATRAEHPTIRVAPSAVPGISDQALSQLSAYKTPFDAVTSVSDIGDQKAIAELAAAGIAFGMQDKPIPALSGGQRSRLAMLLLRLQAPNLYILDEPTNHLDIDGQEALEHELLAHDTTALLVSHDRTFVRTIGTRFWQVVRKRLVEVDSPEPFFAEQLGAS
ncbi:ABC-F family ATP-binding cassette domain-containing protein [Roseovarius faecimaris]|uniref:ABC-F family ATP-binding cassette domain-containing protein n=1 Tax=Roseovarius faecimaris TaxID=2494550 RepID=A0A6I6IT20_9RHOB|nr:ABC-F family ATP-binding cassette domain-containing protein [Roseovarius faecimaris]QGX98667.1 ABC-F family ATP-binding cassette domain-containing protein [Roseovarius faecimaris]